MGPGDDRTVPPQLQPSRSAPAEGEPGSGSAALAGSDAGASEGEALRRDAQWVRRVRQGDAEAFGLLVTAYAARLHGLLGRFLRDADDVADLAQETFVRAFRSLDAYDATRPFYPWLRRIAVNLALNELAKRKVRNPVAEPDDVLSQLAHDGCAEAQVGMRELTEALEQELQRLPSDWAAVFRLRVNEEMSYAEIADALEVPVGSVMSRLSRARARLAQALASRFGPRMERS